MSQNDDDLRTVAAAAAVSMVDLSDGDARGRRRRGRGRRTLLDFVRGVIVPSNFQRWNERFVID